MKRLTVVVLALFLALSLSACKNVSLQAVENVDKTGELIIPEYLLYVQADTKLTDQQRDDRKKLIDSYRRLVGELKKSAQ